MDMPAKGGLGRAIKYLGHYKRLTALAYLFLFISTGAQLAVPQLVQNIIDAVTKGLIAKQLAQVPAAFLTTALQRLGWTPEQLVTYRDGGEKVLVSAILLIVAFAVMRGMFAFAQAYTSERVSQSIAFDYRNDLYAKIQRLSFSYHDRNQTGQLMIRATDDVEKVRLFIGQGLLLALQAFVLLTATLIILATTNLKLTLVVLPVLPVALLLFMVFGAISQPLFAEVQKRLSRLNTVLQENLAGIKVVKSFAREPDEERKFDAAATSLMAQSIKVSRVFSFLFPVVFLIANLGQAAVLYFGGKQIIDGTLSFGEWQKFSLYLVYVFFPIGQLGFIISQMSQASASAARIFEIFDAKNDVADKPGAIVLPHVQGHVTFEDVTFRYFESGEPVLSHVSFEAQPGETVALLGATGSGKTTIINLLPRFYDVNEGHVRIDGYDLRDVTLDSLRSQIGIVLQETNLFSGTIRENIAFGRPDATLAEVTAAAKAASAHDFIMSFPAGYESPVGERGTTLSGGQKQRIAIARALLLNPRLLILDDSTSSVDLQTEFQIQQALTGLMHGRTSFVIAQRITTVVNADQILVLEKGRIVARGKHEDLMENSPLYADIYHSQLVSDVALADEPPARLETATLNKETLR
ncbi:ABC transporter ATP-binding protein [Candidatus Amarolinea aalborgensis]|jgi:ATP-binding cassette subfamily B protein|uniref:ABC transporter ATP-binding protein n=1 Tax=Candidatus Amarolinea aalborgensis TaxID=2249329 RepID=UPI003BFA1FBD